MAANLARLSIPLGHHRATNTAIRPVLAGTRAVEAQMEGVCKVLVGLKKANKRVIFSRTISEEV